MRAIIFCVATLVATTAQASFLDIWAIGGGHESNWHYDPTEPHAKYNTVTGNVSIHNIPATADAMYLMLPSIAMAVDVSEVPGVHHWSRTIRPITRSTFHEKANWESITGFPSEMDLGPILKPNQTIFEWSYLGTSPRQFGNVGNSDPWVMVAVPEPAGLYLGVLAFVVIVTASRIWRMT